jgi:hypothetical protein
VLVLAGIAEAVTRHVIEQQIAAAFHKKLSGPVDVGIGPSPALIDAVTRHFAKITVDAPSTSVCHLHAINMKASVTDVHLDGGQAYAQRISATVGITTTSINDLLAGKIRSATATTDPAAGTLKEGRLSARRQRAPGPGQLAYQASRVRRSAVCLGCRLSSSWPPRQGRLRCRCAQILDVAATGTGWAPAGRGAGRKRSCRAG